MDIVLIVLEERRLTVGALQGIPVQTSPVAVITDANVLQKLRVITFNRDGKGLDTVGGGDEATVAQSLYIQPGAVSDTTAPGRNRLY